MNVFQKAIPSNCENGEIRLSGGVIATEGIIELCMNGVYGGFCGDLFGPKDAKVACRQLGLPEGCLHQLK